jgi:hypothetical protein
MKLPFDRLGTRRNLMTVGAAVVAALVLWRLRTSAEAAQVEDLPPAQDADRNEDAERRQDEDRRGRD